MKKYLFIVIFAAFNSVLIGQTKVNVQRNPGSYTSGHIPMYSDSTGALVQDSGAVPLNGVTSSAGAGDSGKVPLLNGSGVLDFTFQQTITVAKGGTNATTAKGARVNLNQGETALTDAATIATDCSTGNVFTVTLAGNRTLGAPTNMVAGATYIWEFTQGSGGSHTLAYNAAFKFPGGTQPTLTTTAGAVDVITAVSTGTVMLCTFALDLK